MEKFEVTTVSPELLHRAMNPDKGGRPKGAADKAKTGNRNRPRKTQKAAVVAKAAEWHVATEEPNIEVTVEKYFEEYAGGPFGNRRYFRSHLAAKIEEIMS